ncbi:MAG: hypothetical protein OQL08_05800 [Gammaproteobacteria bacterium]|nr:hypothetical protein [Gammaproteobacteria bacterium]
MEAITDFVTQNPLYGFGMAAGALLLIIALVKRMLKLAIIAALLNLAYGYYLQDLAKGVYADAKATYEEGRGKAENLVDEAGSLLQR